MRYAFLFEFPAKITFLLLLSTFHLASQNLPVGYIEQYSNSCNNKSFFKTFIRNDSSLWKIEKNASLKILSLANPDSTASIGLLDQMIFGEYIIEFDFHIDNCNSDSTAFSFLSSMKSATSFYAYAFSTDSIGFFLIKKGFKTLLGKKAILKLKPDWNKVRIEWNIISRNTKIIINNNQGNKIIFNNNQLVMGYLGFANGFKSSSIKNIIIWAPTCITDQKFIW
jgi:hypothetical protein